MCNKHFSFEISFTELRPFLAHWSSRYPDVDAKDASLYDPHIGKTDEGALKELFKWKNGGTIARHKVETINENYLNQWVADADLECRFLDASKPGGPIWNIFYLHCRRPQEYPIYDQHAYRAMIFMQEGRICAVSDDLNSQSRSSVYETYRRYRTFVDIIRRATELDLRYIDRALFTFGQFLKRVRPYCVPDKHGEIAHETRQKTKGNEELR